MQTEQYDKSIPPVQPLRLDLWINQYVYDLLRIQLSNQNRLRTLHLNSLITSRDQACGTKIKTYTAYNNNCIEPSILRGVPDDTNID